MRQYDREIVPGEPTRLPFLVSYAHIANADDDFVAGMLGDPRREVLLDSGAFTAFNAGKEILLADYLSFLHRHADSLFGYMMLDKLQDPVTSAANHRAMISEGLSPIPIHVFGDDQARMDELFGVSSWVALGGLRRPHRGAAPLTYITEKMRWAAGRHVHWLGHTQIKHLAGFAPFSSDCASFTSGRQYGNLTLYIGRGVWWTGNQRKWKALNPRKRSLLRAVIASQYEIDPAVFRTRKGSWSNKDVHSYMHDVNARSWIRYIYEVRFTYGIRLFIATIGDGQDERAVMGALDLAARKGWTVATSEQAEAANRRSAWRKVA